MPATLPPKGATSANPLLQQEGFPDFPTLRPEHVMPAIDQLLADSRTAVEALLDGLQNPSWDTVVAPLEELDARLERAWSPIGHLNSVTNTPAWREAYESAQPLLTAYHTELGQNRRLYEAYRAIAEAPAFATLEPARRKVVENALRDFRLSGVALDDAPRQRFGELKQRLAELGTRFSNNVLDATQGWYKHIAAVAALQGVPASALQLYREAAAARDLDGFVVTLDAPAYLPLMQYAEDRELRQELYHAYTTRASGEGPNAGRWDNSEPMREILALRHELANLLGFPNYAELSLATKMAGSADEVIGFLDDLARRSRPQGEQDREELVAYARDALALNTVEAWDVPFVSEQLRQARYSLSQQDLRPYFPAARVIEGLFAVVERLFAVRFRSVDHVPLWHDDVRVFALERGSETLAWCYLDLYARAGKRGGAWMDSYQSRRRLSDGSLQLPIAFLTCNFTPPTAEAPSLLTHDEVTTLFHEFGHGLHHMLTRVDVAGVSGINGVAWDAVELPSQFLENWCWEPEAIPLLSGHYQDGSPLPAELLQKLLAAKNFQSALFMLRQLEFALFDFRLHREYDPADPVPAQVVLDDVRRQVAVMPPPAYNRFQHGFTHIFGGGYAAGYYSYKWAEVLSADAFAAFEEEGVFNAATGRRFLETILEQGGSHDPIDLYVDFRGRAPSVEALLRHSGIAA